MAPTECKMAWWVCLCVCVYIYIYIYINLFVQLHAVQIASEFDKLFPFGLQPACGHRFYFCILTITYIHSLVTKVIWFVS
jgi:hypothetical protein